MSFVGVVDRIENDLAYIVVQDGLFEISVSLKNLKKEQYKEGDFITVILDETGNASLKGEERHE